VSYNPGAGPYNNPQITISTPLAPRPQQFTNIATLLSANVCGVMIFRNGILMTDGLDYTRVGGAVTFVVPPIAKDVMTAQVFAVGLQLGGATPQRYISPWTLPLTGAFDGVGTFYEIVVGPTIAGVLDGTNNLFTVSLPLARIQLWRNGLLQTLNQDFVAGPTAIVFLPGSIPQPGDILTLLGYNSC